MLFSEVKLFFGDFWGLEPGGRKLNLRNAAESGTQMSLDCSVHDLCFRPIAAMLKT
jgi:hypothetical protein